MRYHRTTSFGLFAAIILALTTSRTVAAEQDGPRRETPAQRGYRLLVSKAYLPPDFTQEVFDELWKNWEQPLREKAAQATPAQRSRMAFARYGLTARPGDDAGGPLQYVVDGEGNWVMNCFACHGGQVAGRVIAGLPNALYDLQTLTEEVRDTKLRMDRPLVDKDRASVFFPLSGSRGTTNAVMFGVALAHYRDADLNVVADRPRPKLLHHDHDAPPWWHFKKRKRLYIDGFPVKDHRALMQFLLVKENGPQRFRQWENDYRDVYAYLESIEPPKYPFEVDHSLAAEGRRVFEQSCANCHGTYGPEGRYKEQMVPIDVIKTDRARHDALTEKRRIEYEQSWFGHYGQQQVVRRPRGYVAPPLDGVWASAPYFHNGSVPTLWHVLHPDQRPAVWRRSEDGYDRQRVGLEVKTSSDVPPDLPLVERRRHFDTRRFGKSAGGHLFPRKLDEPQRRAVLEYLKTL